MDMMRQAVEESGSDTEGKRIAILREMGLGSRPKLDIDPQGERDIAKRYWPYGAIALGLLVGAGLFSAPLRLGDKEMATDASLAKTEAKVAMPRAGGYAAAGYVIARRQATVAAEVTARVLQLPIEEGQLVKKGTILAVLDSEIVASDFNAARQKVAASQAEVRQAQAELEDARSALARIESLRARGFATIAAATTGRARVKGLEAQKDRSEGDFRAQLAEQERTKQQVKKYVIRAPFDGVIVSRSAQVGEVISPMSAGGGFTRTGICTLVDMTSLELQVDVSEAYLSRITIGQVGRAVLDAYPDRAIKSTVVAIIPTINREKGTASIRLKFEESISQVMPNMAVKVYL